MPSSTAEIVLRGSTPPTKVPSEHVYFAFGPGRLSYDCQACNAQCCRGHGYNLEIGRELQSHLANRPAVKFFLDRHEAAKDLYHASNLPPACFFLDSRNSCSIQNEQGFEAKPETCRLFPFNSFLRVDRFVVVRPHPGLCPLRVLPPHLHSDKSQHDNLIATMAANGIGTPIPVGEPICSDVARLVGLERRIVELSEDALEHLDYGAFVAAQAVATDQMLYSVDNLTETNRRTAGLQGAVQLMYTVFGEAVAHDEYKEPALVREMVGATPVVRSHLVFRALEESHRHPERISIDRVPHVLLALHLIVILAHKAGMGQVTFQTIMRILADYRQVLIMLAHLDCEMVWLPSATVELSLQGPAGFQERYLKIARALLPNEQRKTRATVGQILCQNVADDKLEHLVFIKRVAQLLVGRIAPPTKAGTAFGRRYRLRSALRWWMMTKVNQKLLVPGAQRSAPHGAS